MYENEQKPDKKGQVDFVNALNREEMTRIAKRFWYEYFFHFSLPLLINQQQSFPQ